MGMTKTFNFGTDGKVESVTTAGAPSAPVDKETVHHCPRCGSYFYGRFEGFDGNPFFCGNCGYTYPDISVDALREMHKKNGTLEAFDKGEMVEEVGSYDINVQ